MSPPPVSPPPVSPPPVSPPPVSPPPSPEDFRTTEFNNSISLSQLGAEYAYSRGATGKGIVISIHDAGIPNLNDSELAGQILNINDLRGDESYVHSHPLLVARTAVALRNQVAAQGVAYNSKIVVSGSPVKNVNTYWKLYNLEKDYGARISNHSYSFPNVTSQWVYDTMGAPFVEGAKDGRVYVVAAGNQADATDPIPGLAYMPQFNSALLGHWIVVTGLYGDDSNKQMPLAGANPCGQTAVWCIAAPFHNNEGWGTSLASPMVSGSLAILMEMFPTLSSEKIVERLFASANKTGVYANRDLYGQGRLDLQAASEPIGGLSIPFANGQRLSIQDSQIQGAQSLTTSLAKSLKEKRIFLKDSLDAPFAVRADILARRSLYAPLDTADYIERFSQAGTFKNIELPTGTKLRIGPATNGSRLSSLGNVELTQSIKNGFQWHASLNSSDRQVPALISWLDGSNSRDVTGATTNLLPISGQGANALGFSWESGSGWSAGIQSRWSVHPLKGPSTSSYLGNKLQTSLIELNYFDLRHGVNASLHSGLIKESDGLLGTSGALLRDTSSETPFAELILSLRILDNWTLIGRYAASQSRAAGGVWVTDAKVASEAMSLGLFGSPSPRWRLGLSIAQPLAVSGGHLVTNLPTALNSDNSIDWHDTKLTINPGVRHMEYETFASYSIVPHSITFKAGITLIRNYANIESKDDALTMISISKEN
ncbi:hypothetical protein xavtCFBP7764_23390 [Xanthomonas citri]|nr:hypothetical protein xavtCFBP7764_23390 [Xanthomonas citri]